MGHLEGSTWSEAFLVGFCSVSIHFHSIHLSFHIGPWWPLPLHPQFIVFCFWSLISCLFLHLFTLLLVHLALNRLFRVCCFFLFKAKLFMCSLAFERRLLNEPCRVCWMNVINFSLISQDGRSLISHTFTNGNSAGFLFLRMGHPWSHNCSLNNFVMVAMSYFLCYRWFRLSSKHNWQRWCFCTRRSRFLLHLAWLWGGCSN